MAAPTRITRTSPSVPVQDPAQDPVITHSAAEPIPGPSGGRRAGPGSAGLVERWWLPGLMVGLVCVGATVAITASTAITGSAAWPRPFATGSVTWWIAVAATHVPFVVIALFLIGGVIERVGYFRHGRTPVRPGRLPANLPIVCVQLPMFNEREVGPRAIEAACALDWPGERLRIQVLDDSTDRDTRLLIEETCRRMRQDHGVDCTVRHRNDRRGYKAGALEEGRHHTDAEFLAIFDADFVPPVDFLRRAVPHFYDDHGVAHPDLALVQAQWGHLNHDESALTRAQALWVDDHHSIQMSWRSARWQFVNFTGTAGIWRADAIEVAGGWRAASLVEDCELSFRHLFAGYRTTFVNDIVAPAELPGTFVAYKAQQKRWTQGWVQLQRLHLRTLLTRYPAKPLRRLHLLYHMCIGWQWPAWALWAMLFPLVIASGLWLGALGTAVAATVYLLPGLSFLVTATLIATLETRHTYEAVPGSRRRRLAWIAPFAIINTGMLAHQSSAFAEGLFGPMHSEFERTPKTGAEPARPDGVGPSPPESSPPESNTTESSTTGSDATVRPTTARRRSRRPYALAEWFFVTYQGTWALLFLDQGLIVCAVGATWLALCVTYVAAGRS